MRSYHTISKAVLYLVTALVCAVFARPAAAIKADPPASKCELATTSWSVKSAILLDLVIFKFCQGPYVLRVNDGGKQYKFNFWPREVLEQGETPNFLYIESALVGADEGAMLKAELWDYGDTCRVGKIWLPLRASEKQVTDTDCWKKLPPSMAEPELFLVDPDEKVHLGRRLWLYLGDIAIVFADVVLAGVLFYLWRLRTTMRSDS